jgi:hypothetical protein
MKARSLALGLSLVWFVALLPGNSGLAAPDTPTTAATSPYDWGMNTSRPSGDQARSGETFRLVNRTYRHAITYGERKYGINLVWTAPTGPGNVFFARQGASGQPLVYGARVAIHVADGGYLRYGVRKYGINLVWSSSPVYEWEIRGRPTGSPVRWGDIVGLWNSKIKRYVHYGSRLFGINLVWYSGSTAPATTATLSPGWRIPAYSSTLRCTGTVSWRFDPINLTGTTGTSTAIAFDTPYDVFVQTSGNEYWCNVRARTTSSMRVGRWRVTGQTPLWRATCELDLPPGTTLVNFTQTRDGCTTGFNWP